MAKRDFLGSRKDAGIFLGSQKKPWGLFAVLYFSSAQINNNVKAIYMSMWDFFGYAKNIVIFLIRQILKLGFFGVENMNPCQTPPGPLGWYPISR